MKNKIPIEAHRWNYDYDTFTQKLVRLDYVNYVIQQHILVYQE